MNLFKSTKQHTKYWQERKLDWNKAFGGGDGAWNHPHRFFITYLLKTFYWKSLFEVGCGGGANLINILKQFKNVVQVGGCDVNQDAIDLNNKTFTGAHFKVGSVIDVPMSDDSVDVVLSDMCLIYVSPSKIQKAIGEMRRVARERVIICEFHSRNPLLRLWLKIKTGYNAHNYYKILEQQGFYDIALYKIPENAWPGGNPQKDFGYVIMAKVPRRK